MRSFLAHLAYLASSQPFIGVPRVAEMPAPIQPPYRIRYEASSFVFLVFRHHPSALSDRYGPVCLDTHSADIRLR